MPVKDGDLLKTIDKLADHYGANINNRYIRKALLQVKIPQGTWDLLDRLVARSGYAEAAGYQFEELYEMELAAATFVFHTRTEVLPSLRTLVSRGVGAPRSTGGINENVLRDMAVRNFPANLGILADLINELYMKTVELDRKANAGKRCVFERVPELRDMGKLLIAE